MDTTFLQDLVVRAGQRISYNIPIEASPRPKVTWTVNGQPIVAGTRADIQTFEKETVFEIPFSVRADTGKYTIKLENDLGFCSASAHVTVLGKFQYHIIEKLLCHYYLHIFSQRCSHIPFKFNELMKIMNNLNCRPTITTSRTNRNIRYHKGKCSS